MRESSSSTERLCFRILLPKVESLFFLDEDEEEEEVLPLNKVLLPNGGAFWSSDPNDFVFFTKVPVVNDAEERFEKVEKESPSVDLVFFTSVGGRGFLE